MKRLFGLFVVIALTVVINSYASEIKRIDEAKKPEIWMNSDIKAVMQAERVARADAMRKMIEKLYGVKVSADQTVYDMIRENSNVKAEMDHILTGMREKEWHYYPEGICQVELEITWKEVLKKIKKTVSANCDGCEAYLEKSVKITEETSSKKIVVWGSGAIAGTEGVQEIQALRAAEIDAYKKMAQRILGVKINSETTVKDMVVKSDKIRNCVEGVIKGATLYDYTFEPRRVTVKCRVKMKKLVVDLSESLSAEKDTYGVVTYDAVMDFKAKTKVDEFIETGVGLISDISDNDETQDEEHEVISNLEIVITEEGGVVIE